MKPTAEQIERFIAAADFELGSQSTAKWVEQCRQILRADRDHIVMKGNPVAGFEFYGPFTEGEATSIFGHLDKITEKIGAIWFIRLTARIPI